MGSGWNPAAVARLTAQTRRHAPRPAPDEAQAAPGAAVAVVGGNGASFGIVEVPEFVGKRFVVVAAGPALVAELAAVCRAHGLQELATGHFLARSQSHGEAKEKPGKETK